jgi:two-component system OmpR family response regulator
LIVDDDHALADLLVIMLGLEGFRAEAAYSGREALASAAKETPDAVILDVMMPDMDGFAVLRALRADGKTETVPVMMLSARVDEETREQCLAAGANNYLTKPADSHFLTSELRSHIARRAGAQPE